MSFITFMFLWLYIYIYEEGSTYSKSNSSRVTPYLHHSFSLNLIDKISDLLQLLDFKKMNGEDEEELLLE